MEKKMENEMETGVIKGLYRDPSIEIIPTLGPKVCKYYLHWAVWSLRATLPQTSMGTRRAREDCITKRAISMFGAA